MSTAKKSVLTLLGFICLTVAGSFIAAKISQKKKSRLAMPSSPRAAEAALSATKPFFYTSIGGSNPDISVTHATQKLSKFTVNIRTFNNKAEAEKLLASLTAAGLSAYYTPVRQADRVLYHVRIGIFSDEQEAARALATIQKKTTVQGSVTQLQ